jgi:thioredoxin 1
MSVSHVTGKNFDEFVSGNGVTVVDFGAPWCAPCKAMKPVMDDFAKKHAGKVRVAMVDVEEECALAGRMHISSLPHIAVYKNGELVETLVGALPPAKLAEKISLFF